MIEIRLPKPGPEIEKASITKWECTEGDKIQIGDILAIIKTPIGSFKVAAEEQGILENILQTEGSSIDFDEPIAMMRPDLTISDFPDLSGEEDETMPLPIDTESELNQEAYETEHDVSDDEQETLPDSDEESDTIDDADEDGLDFEDEETDSVTNDDESEDPAEVAIEESEPAVAEEVDEAVQEPFSIAAETIHIATPEVEVSPAAKKMAEREGIDLSNIVGTGDNGKILYIDVENAISERQAATESQDTVEADDLPLQVDDIPSVDSWDSNSLTEEDSAPEQEQTFPEPMEEQTFPEPEQDPDGDEVDTRFEEAEGRAEEEIVDAQQNSNEEIQELEPDSDTPLETVPQDVILTDAVIETEPNLDAEAATPDLPFPDFQEISTQFHLSKKDDLIIPFNSNKKAFAETQLDSNRNVPHFYLYADIDLTDALEWISKHNQSQGSRVTLTDLYVKATGQALAMMPEMNAFVRSDRMILKRSINIGLTTSVDEGVVTPVIPDVYHKSLHKISDTVKKNVDLAVKTKVVLDYDTTFTIHLLHESGIKRIMPLIIPPQTGCLALGSIQKQVVPLDNFIAIRNIMEVTLACDSRAVDTTNAAKFLQSIKESLETLKPGAEDPDWIEGNEQLRLI